MLIVQCFSFLFFDLSAKLRGPADRAEGDPALLVAASRQRHRRRRPAACGSHAPPTAHQRVPGANPLKRGWVEINPSNIRKHPYLIKAVSVVP